MAEYIKVKPTKDDNKVCLFEYSDQHPGNEVFIVNDGKTYKVGLTAEVAKRIKDGALVQVGGSKSADVEPAAPSEAPVVEDTKSSRKAK